MALNHFVSQVKENKAEQLADNAMNISQAQNVPQIQNKQTRLNKVPASTIQQPKASIHKNVASQEAVEAAIQNEKSVNPVVKEIPLTWSDQQMLCALSAMQVRYGRSAEAIPYLMMIRKINPRNVECSRLLALAFMRLNRWQEAEAMIEELDYLQKADSGSVLDGVVLLYRSLISFKTNKIADAKSWFNKFRTFNKVN